MLIYSCRQPAAPMELVPARGRWQEMAIDGTTRDITFVPPSENGHAVILVHGFNTDLIRLREAYLQLETNIQKYATEKVSIFGFSWPSQTVTNYIRAYNLCDPTALHLLDMVRRLRMAGYAHISIFCHSMGSIVTMRMVELCEVGEIYRIVIEQGDAYVQSFQAKQRYGIACSRKMNALFSYYSAGDEVLGFVARVFGIIRPGIRVGAVRFLKTTPEMYRCFDAQKIHGSEVDHGTFLTSQVLIRHAVERLCGALGA